MSSPYAEFGVNNAVVSSNDPEEHVQNMLALDVLTRDGDTSVDIHEEEEEEGEAPEGEEGAEGEEGEGEEGEEGEELAPLGEPDSDLKAAMDSLASYADGFTHMRDQAIKNGLPADTASSIEAEYESDAGISDKSYEALEKAGYSRQFVESYIKGQEAVTEQYVAKIMDYAGGKDQFQKIIQHLGTSSPGSVESLYEAFERQDINSIRTIINLGNQGFAKKFGKAPVKSVIKSAPAPKASTPSSAVEGYADRAAMIKDMSSHAYRHDAKYRATVEAKVHASKF
jgi:hypothetical protein